MSAIRDDRYVHNGHYFTWGKGDARVFYRLSANGRFLYVDSGAVTGEVLNPGYAGARTAFLQEVGLHEHPRETWREILEPIVEQLDLTDHARTYTVTPFDGDVGTLHTDRPDLRVEFSSDSRDWSYDILVWIKADGGFHDETISWEHDVGITDLWITSTGGHQIGHVSFNDAVDRLGYRVAAANPVRAGYRLALVAEPQETHPDEDREGRAHLAQRVE